jgi:hypothetical protein
MIKFFRHIRKSIIQENWTSKYLLYAIGEIILVVIIQKYNLNLKTFTNRSPLGRG